MAYEIVRGDDSDACSSGRQLISQDLRFNAMPLYFSRPLRRSDYFLGKLAVIGGFLGMVIIVPALIAYVLGLAFSLDISILRDTFPLLLSVIALRRGDRGSAGTLILAVSSLSRNSRIVGLFWVGLWFVSNIIGIDAQHGLHVRASGDSARWADLLLGSTNERNQLASARFLHRESVAAIGQQLLGTDACWRKSGRSAASRHARRVPVMSLGPAISLVLVGRGADRVVCDFRLDSALPGSIAGSPQMKPIVVFHEVSKWYGNVIGLNKLSIQRAGRRYRAARPQRRRKIDAAATGHRPAFSHAGRSPRAGPTRLEQPVAESLHRALPRARCILRMDDRPGFHLYSARLSGMSAAPRRDAAARTLEAVGMTRNKDRAIRGYSKGMRQRTKLAQALVHDPQVLFLDEPLTGTDPVARRDLMDIIQRLAREGKSVLFSSHVLHEVQSMTPFIILLNHGRLVAEGQIRQIRDLIDSHPHHIAIVCNEYRKLAAQLLAEDDVDGVRVIGGRAAIDGRNPLARRFLWPLARVVARRRDADRGSLFRRRQFGSRVQISGE